MQLPFSFFRLPWWFFVESKLSLRILFHRILALYSHVCLYVCVCSSVTFLFLQTLSSRNLSHRTQNIGHGGHGRLGHGYGGHQHCGHWHGGHQHLYERLWGFTRRLGIPESGMRFIWSSRRISFQVSKCLITPMLKNGRGGDAR